MTILQTITSNAPINEGGEQSLFVYNGPVAQVGHWLDCPSPQWFTNPKESGENKIYFSTIWGMSFPSISEPLHFCDGLWFNPAWMKDISSPQNAFLYLPWIYDSVSIERKEKSMLHYKPRAASGQRGQHGVSKGNGRGKNWPLSKSVASNGHSSGLITACNYTWKVKACRAFSARGM